MRPPLAIAHLLVLALWLGAAVFFAAAVAPALFGVLPSRALAGAVVARLLPVIFYSGMLIGVALLLAGLGAPRAWSWRRSGIADLVIVASCAVGQFVVAPRIERARTSITGAIEDLPLDDARRVAFGRLHGMSVAWLGLAMLAAAWAIAAAARQLSSRR